jgi:RimJ/RimL family protein N-acetyltransferase
LLFAVTDATGRVIGSITLREIDGRRSARLGITLGADFVDQGYGTEALTLFLNYFFEGLGFQKMVLDVAGFNQRAICVYERLGFQKVDQWERPAGHRDLWSLLKEPHYADVRRYFRRDWLGRRWLLCFEMELVKETWEKRRNDLGVGIRSG